MTQDRGIDWEFCPECHARRPVVGRSVETSVEGAYMRRSTTEVDYAVTYFECGHQRSEQRGSTTYRDPS